MWLRLRRSLWLVVLALLLLVALAVAGALAVLGSETGSRWLLERGQALQSMVSLEYEGGTFLGGLAVSDVHVRTAKVDVRIQHLLARWAVLDLLQAEVGLDILAAREVDIRRLTPPAPDNAGLPRLALPLRLDIGEARVDNLRFWPYQAPQPLTLRHLELAGQWRGTRVQLDRLLLEQEQLGRLELAGRIRLRGGYPLEAEGRFDYRGFRAQGWQPLTVQFSGSVADLGIKLFSQGGLNATAQGRLQPLKPELPYQAFLQWQALTLPWWPDQALSSQGGHLRVQGNRAGLRAQGEAQLAGRHLPAGRYTLKGRTDWQSAQIERVVFSGLGGKAQFEGEVSWRQGLRWNLQSRLEGIDLARKWPVPRQALPVLTGRVQSAGHTSAEGSALDLSAELAGGERWDIHQEGEGWPWNLEASQQVSARWRQVRRPLPDGQWLYSEGGRLQASGSRQQYQAELAARLSGSLLPAGQVEAAVQGQGPQLQVQNLRYQGEAGQLAFQGQLGLGMPLAWQGALQLQDLRTGWLLPDWSGQFSGQLAGSGVWARERRHFDLEELHLSGRLRDEALAVDGPLQVTLVPGDWPEVRSPSLNARWGRNRAVLIGGLRDGRWDLSSQLNLGELGLLHPALQGRVEGELALQGPERRPDVQLALTGESLGFQGWLARSARLEGSVQALGEERSRLQLAVDALAGKGGQDWGQLELELAGTRDDHRLDWQAKNDRVTGQGSLSGRLAGRDWLGRMETGQVSLGGMEWRLNDAFALAWRQAQRQLALAAHCWVSGEARLCNEEELRVGQGGHVRLSLEGLALERLAGVMPEGLVMTGQASGSAAGDWQPGEPPTLVAELSAREGQFRLAREGSEQPLVLAYDRIALAADADPRNVELALTLVSPDMGQGRLRASIDPFTAGKPVKGELALQGLRLEVFQPFFPALTTLAGKLSADGRLQGALARPEFFGTVQLAAGELAFQRLPLQVRDLTSRIEVNGTSAVVTGSMKSGEGSARLSGDADWSGTPRLSLALQGERFQLRQPPELSAQVSPDLRLRLVPGQVDITGTVRVPSARLNLQPLGNQGVALSPDVRIVRRDAGEYAVVAEQVEGWDINADVRLVLGDDVQFEGYGLSGRLTGSLRLRQEGQRGLEATGEVQLVEGARYEAYGQRLEIRRGRLIFAGNLAQPGLDVEAIRRVDDQVVGVRVTGRANAPEAELFSDEPMSQEQIVSYLVLGRPLNEETGRPEAGNPNLAAAAAAIRLGAKGGAGLTTKVGETLGISDFAVDAEGTGDDTQVTVSGYISPRLYLRYGVGIFTPVNTTTVRYRISPRLYLEAVSSLESAIDLFYNLRF